MADANGVYQKGALILFEQGEYSDRSTIAVGRALMTFDARAYLKRWKELHPPSDPDNPNYYGWEEDSFLPWLAKEKVIEEVDTEMCHIGAYGRLGINGDY